MITHRIRQPQTPEDWRALRRLERRLDQSALQQLRAHAAALQDQVEALKQENQRLYEEAQSAMVWAEQWRDDFNRLCEETSTEPGLTKEGRLVSAGPA